MCEREREESAAHTRTHPNSCVLSHSCLFEFLEKATNTTVPSCPKIVHAERKTRKAESRGESALSARVLRVASGPALPCRHDVRDFASLRHDSSKSSHEHNNGQMWCRACSPSPFSQSGILVRILWPLFVRRAEEMILRTLASQHCFPRERKRFILHLPVLSVTSEVTSCWLCPAGRRSLLTYVVGGDSSSSAMLVCGVTLGYRFEVKSGACSPIHGVVSS